MKETYIWGTSVAQSKIVIKGIDVKLTPGADPAADKMKQIRKLIETYGIVTGVLKREYDKKEKLLVLYYSTIPIRNAETIQTALKEAMNLDVEVEISEKEIYIEKNRNKFTMKKIRNMNKEYLLEKDPIKREKMKEAAHKRDEAKLKMIAQARTKEKKKIEIPQIFLKH